MEFKEVIDHAGKLFKKSELGRMNVLIGAWNTIDWKEVPHVQGLAACHDSDPEVINIFGDFQKAERHTQLQAVITAFGVSVFERFATSDAKSRWEAKLTLPESAQIEAVQAKLRDKSFKTYRNIMESFDSLMDRYVSLNLTNALQANGVNRLSATNLDLRRWGSTLEYASIRKMHSLKPFVTAYGPKEVAECPGRGLAEKLVYDMGHITESSLARSFGRLIVESFALCRDTA